MMPTEHPTDPNPRLLAKVLRSVLAVDTFESLADLTAVLKHRCARMRIPYSADAITEAYACVGSNAPLLTGMNPGRAIGCRHTWVNDGICIGCGWLLPDVTAVSRAEATAILHRLGVAQVA